MDALYGMQAEKWARDKPVQLGDFIGVPRMIEMVKETGAGKRILDLGCGDGYSSRPMREFAESVTGIDYSVELLKRAKAMEAGKGRRIEYVHGDVRKIPFEDGNFDIATGFFITNNFGQKELHQVYGEAGRVLAKNGRIYFLMPHPRRALGVRYDDIE